jgi:hypothetical protein
MNGFKRFKILIWGGLLGSEPQLVSEFFVKTISPRGREGLNRMGV